MLPINVTKRPHRVVQLATGILGAYYMLVLYLRLP